MHISKKFGLVFSFAYCASLLLAVAAEWDFYGSARVKSFYEWQDAADGKTFADGDDKDVDFHMGLQPNSRIGAKVKVNEELSGHVELAVSESTVNNRLLVGHWNFGSGIFSIGQGYTPVDCLGSARVWDDDGGLLAFGEPYTGRRPMLQLAMQGFKVALVKPHTMSNIQDKDNKQSEIDNIMPRVELSYMHKMDMLSLDAVGGIHSYDIESPEQSFEVTSFLAGGGFKLMPGDFYLRGVGYFARNARQFGQYLSPQPATFGSAKFLGGNVVDNDVLAGGVYAGTKLGSSVNGEIGYGYTQSEDDVASAKKEKWHAVYAQASITLTKGVTFTPEVGIVEDMETNFKSTYFGAKWQANF